MGYGRTVSTNWTDQDVLVWANSDLKVRKAVLQTSFRKTRWVLKAAARWAEFVDTVAFFLEQPIGRDGVQQYKISDIARRPQAAGVSQPALQA